MTKSNSFTDKERAAWHEDRRRGNQGEADAGNFSVSGETCINCGAPLGQKIPEGYEGALCGACDQVDLARNPPFEYCVPSQTVQYCQGELSLENFQFDLAKKRPMVVKNSSLDLGLTD